MTSLVSRTFAAGSSLGMTSEVDVWRPRLEARVRSNRFDLTFRGDTCVVPESDMLENDICLPQGLRVTMVDLIVDADNIVTFVNDLLRFLFSSWCLQ